MNCMNSYKLYFCYTFCASNKNYEFRNFCLGTKIYNFLLFCTWNKNYEFCNFCLRNKSYNLLNFYSENKNYEFYNICAKITKFVICAIARKITKVMNFVQKI